jgi:hypothetical protein
VTAVGTTAEAVSASVVRWPGRRLDVVEGLKTLAAEPPVLARWDDDPRWPDLTNAVHRVVDDTSWDHRDPAESIGTILRDVVEAEVAGALVRELVAVSGRAGDVDRRWFDDDRWPEVRRLADALVRLMERPG